MLKNRIFFSGLIGLILAFTVVAQSTPSDVSDLVGARAAGGETQLEQRGYKFVKVTEGTDRKWANWWNGKSKVCLSVVTMNGRYDSIVSVMPFDCGQNADSNGGGQVEFGKTPSDVSDLVGARGSSGESQLEQRGYKFVKVTEGTDRKWANWWNQSRRVCLTVATVNGRYDSIVAGLPFDCNQ